MNIEILAFGIAKDIIKGSKLSIEVEAGISVGDLKTKLCAQYPEFKKLTSLAIAVNTAYQNDDYILSADDEVVIIPPVSGG